MRNISINCWHDILVMYFLTLGQSCYSINWKNILLQFTNYTWISDQHIPYHNSLLETIEYYHISSLLSSLLFVNTTPRHFHDIRCYYVLRIFCTLKVPIRNISIYKYQAKIYSVVLISTSWIRQTFFSQSYAMFIQHCSMIKTLHAKILRT